MHRYSGVSACIYMLRCVLKLSLLCVILTLISCASSSSSKRYLEVTLIAEGDLNPDINHRPSPIAITIYQLAGSQIFAKADYISLSENSQLILGRDLIASHELILHPGQTIMIEYPIAKHEQAFGVVAHYRVIDKSKWQVIYEYPSAGEGFWSRFGGKEISAHKILLQQNSVQRESAQQQH